METSFTRCKSVIWELENSSLKKYSKVMKGKGLFISLIAALAMMLCPNKLSAQEADWHVLVNCEEVYVYYGEHNFLSLNAGDELKIVLTSDAAERQLSFFFDLSGLVLNQDMELSSNAAYSSIGEILELCDGGVAYTVTNTGNYKLDFKDDWQDIEYSGDHDQFWTFHSAGITLNLSRLLTVPGPTAIEQAEAGMITEKPIIYNILGQRVPTKQSGLNVINGKKVL